MMKVGFYKLTSCAGCQINFLDLEEEIPTLLNFFDMIHFPMAKSGDAPQEKNFDIAFVEGAVSTAEEIREIKRIREESRVLIAFGDCACNGGVNAMKNFMIEGKAEGMVYEKPSALSSMKVCGIGEYVPVELYLKGCPPPKAEILEVLTSAIIGRKPFVQTWSVCMECKLLEFGCLLLKGEPCMGPVTKAGCNANCPSRSRACEGCGGTMSDANVGSLVEKFREIGLKDEDINRKFSKYTAGEYFTRKL